VAAVVGHSLGSVTALHLAANTDLCQSLVFVNGLGMKPHRLVLSALDPCQ